MPRTRACVLFLALTLLGVAAAQEKFPGWVKSELKKTYGASTASPFTRELRKKADAKQVLADFNVWFKDLAADVQKRRKESDGSECTLRGQSWIQDARNYFEYRRIVQVDKSCATRTEHAARSQRDDAFALLKRSAGVMQRAGEQVVVRDPGVRALWGGSNRTFSFAGLQYESDKQKCGLDFATAVRVKGQWHIVAAVTSPEVTVVGPERNRIVEYVPMDPALPSALVMVLPEKGGPEDRNSTYTTEYVDGVGAAAISHLTVMRFDGNRPLTAALEENLLAVDQANDALTKSNFAILALPLAMSFIPVSLIADVSDAATFFYVLLTDVFSAVPFVIKGIELVQTGSQRTRKAETWLVGEADGPAAAETWAAECTPLDSFRTQGVIVILVGLGTIAFGIFLEYATRKWMARRRQQGEHPEPLGPALLRMEAYIPIGAHYVRRDADYDDPLAPNMAADFPPPPQPAAPDGADPGARARPLFSGMLWRLSTRRLFRRYAADRADADQAAADRAAADPEARAAGIGTLGVLRRRGSGPDAGAEYDEPGAALL